MAGPRWIMASRRGRPRGGRCRTRRPRGPAAKEAEAFLFPPRRKGVFMRRRQFFNAALASGAAAALFSAKEADAQQAAARAARGMPSPKIRDVSVIECAPQGVRLTVVKITTDQAGLYGYGCATYTQRADLVKPAVEKYIRPFLIGKPADRIEDTWQVLYNSSYWRNAADRSEEHTSELQPRG